MQSKLLEVYEIIKRSYLHAVDDAIIIDGAIEGMLEAIGDKYAKYIAGQEMLMINPAHEGIGINAPRTGENEILITEVFENSSANKSGLERFDTITKVDGVAVKDLGYHVAANAIRGEVGSTVNLEVQRADGTPFACSVVRQRHVRQSVFSKLLESGIGIIRITFFSEISYSQFAEQLNKLLEADIKGLIIDVRNNPGGQTCALVNFLNTFLPEGLVMTAKNHNSNQEQKFYSDKESIKIPLAILINQYTASSAELFSAILQDYIGACIVGEPTHGKGVAVEEFTLADGSQLVISTVEMFAAQGISLKKKTIPDILIEQTPDIELDGYSGYLSNDPYVEAAVAAILDRCSEADDLLT